MKVIIAISSTASIVCLFVRVEELSVFVTFFVMADGLPTTMS